MTHITHEEKLLEADIQAETTDVRYTHEEIFTKLRERKGED